jgi:hypothetical protein
MMCGGAEGGKEELVLIRRTLIPFIISTQSTSSYKNNLFIGS